MPYEEFEKSLREAFKGYHVDIDFYPTGGAVFLYGCDECGTDEKITESARWKTHKGESLSTAIEKLKGKL